MTRPEIFMAWWSIHMQKQQFKPMEPLYHYTNAAGLLGMLQKGEVWFTSMYHLNDPSEVRFGRELAIQTLRNLDDGLDDLCEAFQERFSGRDFRMQFEQFVACFSREPDTLEQWRAYGDNGRGFAIGLKPAVFEAKDIGLSDEDCWVTEVAYGERARALFREPMEKWLHSMRADPNAKSNEISWMTALTLIFMWYSMRIKHEAYEKENEVRLIMQDGGLHPLTKNIKFRIRGSSLVPYVTRGIGSNNPENIHEIVIGPAADDAALDALHTLAKTGPLKSVQLRESKIPYKAL